ncbi:ferredoxin family protein [Clostridium sp. 'deep sea']|jgi:2-oxoglutarate ferredoxin oxidoreductase subunit delta|uniref:4Fe-4S dicluster domain-containing protein n=1 Tax=Clostridium sp. 'deep sea' TaxID=2779445 RepID=UPI0018968008|nr:ferredoxin family protein [Clostridium sp. 'deep sea']QOR35835.1 ferredoxin family protein [Clostridium sp. 'deep sea']
MAKTFSYPVFQEDRCKGCALCTQVCPKDIVKMSDRINKKGYFVATVTDKSKCIGCSFCAKMCPDVVIEIHREVKEEE